MVLRSNGNPVKFFGKLHIDVLSPLFYQYSTKSRRMKVENKIWENRTNAIGNFFEKKCVGYVIEKQKEGGKIKENKEG